jgi:hypothetical protein
LLIPWLVFPLALVLLAVGAGLLVQRIAGVAIPGALVAPVGLGAIVVAGEFTTLSDATAELTVPVVVAMAVAGAAVSLPWRRRVDGWALGAAVAVFAVFAAPVVLSGEPTFAGFIKLDDTATWFAITDRIMDHGHSLAGLPPSSYEATLAFNLGSGYPIGAFIPLGAGAKLVGQDVSLVFQPYLAFLAAMLALALYSLAGRLLSSRPLRALAAFIPAQAALLYGYSLWGGIKELATAALLALFAALAPLIWRAPAAVRATVPLAVVAAAALAILSPAGAIAWLGPMLVLMVVVVVRRHGYASAARSATALLAVAAAISLPWLLATGFLPPTSSPLTSGTALGNLLHPLNPLQIFGVWPTGDFRTAPADLDLTHLLIAVVLLAGAGGLIWAARRGDWEPVVYVAGAVLACVAIGLVGSAWVGGKALATASPAIPFAAICLAGLAYQRGRRLEAGFVAALVAVGVVWSNALAYHDVSLAPRPQLAELQQIGEMVAGQGPALMTEYEPYGVRHFLRDAAPEGDAELRRRTVPLRNGELVPKGGYADIDRLGLSGVLVYRTLVLRRSPVSSRPPSPFARIWSGHYYEVWQRPARFAPPLDHLSLGSALDPSGRPSCHAVRSLAARPGVGRLASVERPAPSVSDLAPTTTTMRVHKGGSYGLWLGGSFRGEVELSVDGRSVGALRDQLNNTGQFTEFGSVDLAAGDHRVELRQSADDLRPGSGGAPLAMGPLVLSREPDSTTITYTAPANASRLCGRRLDWVEALPN